MATRMQQRRGTAAQWTSANPILNAAEIGYETDTNKFKIGDGTNHWANLSYFVDANTLIDGAPGLLNTLNELAAAIGDDPAFITTVSTNLSNHESDTTNVHGITDTAELATKTFAAELLTNAIKSNITITGNKNGLTITAENGVADSNTDNLVEGSTNKYFTDERAQDAIGNSLGSGLSYNDSTGAISVDTTAIQAKVSGVSDTEIGYLDGVTSAIQTQIDSKAPTANPTFTGTVAGVTKAHVGLSNVDNTSDANKPVSSATQTALDAKLNLAGGTMSGALTLSGAPSSDLHAATKLYVDNVTAGINFHQAAHAATTANLSADYNNGTNGVGATLTAAANGTWTTLDGHTSFTQYDRILVKDQTDAKQNGIYVLSDLGSGSSKWILTRATDADNNPSGEIKNGDFVLVLNGTVNASYGFVNNSATNPIAIGTDNITYVAFNAGKTVVAGNGLQEATPGTISIDTSITQTRVSGVSDTEIGYLDGVTSGIQTQLDSKLASATAASTYAPLAAPTFTGTVTLPSTTSIGNVSATEIGYVDGVTSAIQTQLDAKIAKADISAKGAILVGTGAGTYAAQTVGTNGQVLTANSAQADGVEWTTISSYSAPTLGSTSIASGATVTTIAGLTLTAPTLTGTVTASGDINLTAAGGPGSLIDELTLLVMGAI